MKPKLRTIITTKRPTSVPRKAMRAAAKAVTAARDPKTDLIVRGLASPGDLAAFLNSLDVEGEPKLTSQSPVIRQTVRDGITSATRK